MRAISLWQPWAQLIVTGNKMIETRHWKTNVRGEIAIHATKRKPNDTFAHVFGTDIPLGAIVGTAQLIDCVPIEQLYGSQYDTKTERSYGDWKQGRYGWVLRSPKLFVNPVFINGHQGFWLWDEKCQDVV